MVAQQQRPSGSVVAGEQLAVDLTHRGEFLARVGERLLELEGALLSVFELRAQLPLAVCGELVCTRCGTPPPCACCSPATTSP
jgi:hypothetical protein